MLGKKVDLHLHGGLRKVPLCLRSQLSQLISNFDAVLNTTLVLDVYLLSVYNLPNHLILEPGIETARSLSRRLLKAYNEAKLIQKFADKSFQLIKIFRKHHIVSSERHDFSKSQSRMRTTCISFRSFTRQST